MAKTCQTCGVATPWSTTGYCRAHRNYDFSARRKARVDVKCCDCGAVRSWLPCQLSRRLPKRCFSCSLKAKEGKNNSNWRGGTKNAGRAFRRSRAYKDWRKAVFERDGYTCIWCGQRGGELHADHIKPFAYYPELRLELSNGRTLCKPCHAKTDTYQWRVFAHRPRRPTDAVDAVVQWAAQIGRVF